MWFDGDGLKQTVFGKGENPAATDYQMVRHPDIHQGQCLNQTFSNKPVCLTGCDFTGRVIVRQHHGSGIVVQGAFNHFRGWTSVRLMVPVKRVSPAIN